MSEQDKSLLVDAGTKQRQWCQKSDLTIFFAIKDHFEKKIVSINNLGWGFREVMVSKNDPTNFLAISDHFSSISFALPTPPEGGGAQWAKSEGEAVLLGYSGFTKDPMHDFNRLFC